ncbi:unnamed protein product [Allacma fusca]|uniref:Uncharacterized protein n=1 Tax=Allacma fusca TaxID=39272 RepID=A0A8J2PC53_9HEXA|nr:unnamed protein product [Allacma fusca]
MDLDFKDLDKSASFSFVQARLVEIGIWPIRMLQTIGLFPLKVSNGRIYPTKIFTPEFNLTIIVITLKVAFDSYYFYNLSYFNKVSHLKRPTEIFANSGFAISVSASSNLLRLLLLLKSENFIANWTKFYKNISIISESPNLSICKGGKYERFFEQLRRENRNGCIIIIGECLYMALAITARRFLEKQGTVVWTNALSVVLFYMSIIFWLCTTFFYGAIGIFINYCIKIIAVYLSAISKELQEAIGLAKLSRAKAETGFSQKQELVYNSLKIEDCLKAFLLIEELSMASNLLNAAGVIMVLDTMTASVCVLLYAFLNFNWIVAESWVMVGGSFTIMTVFSSRLYFYSENANKMDEGVKDVLHQLVCIAKRFSNLGSDLIFKIDTKSVAKVCFVVY